MYLRNQPVVNLGYQIHMFLGVEQAMRPLLPSLAEGFAKLRVFK